MSGLTIASLALAAVYLLLLAGKALLAARYAGNYPRAEPSRGAGVAIAQAILSGDPLLESRLRANAEELDQATFLWLVDTDDPEAQCICARLRDELPQVAIEVLVVEPAPSGVNPKLWKLERARASRQEVPEGELEGRTPSQMGSPPLRFGEGTGGEVFPARESHSAGDEIFVVLDDDTLLPRASLGALIAALERAEVATGLPRYHEDGRWPSRLLCQFVANNAAMTYLSLGDLLPPITLNGMTWAARRSTLERFGLFQPILRCLTDDFAVARQIIAGGGQIEQTPLPQHLETTVEDGGHYLRLMHRWFLFATLLLDKQKPAFAALIGLLHGLPPLLLGSALILAAAAGSLEAALGAAALLLARAAILLLLQRRIYGAVLYRPIFSELSELLQPLHLLHATLSRRIRWRKRRYQVIADDDFRPV